MPRPPARIDYSNIRTKDPQRPLSQADVDAARRAARPKPAQQVPDEMRAHIGRMVARRFQHTVIGKWENKGRAPMFKLSTDQFNQFQATGSWSGNPRMPTPEEYGPHSAGNDDKEWRPL